MSAPQMVYRSLFKSHMMNTHNTFIYWNIVIGPWLLTRKMGIYSLSSRQL